MQPQSRNHLIFFALAALVLGGYFVAQPYLFPTKKPADDESAAKGDDKDKEKEKPKEKDKKEEKPGEALRDGFPTATSDKDLTGLRLGGSDAKSAFELEVQLDPLGGGVRSILLNKFRAADVNGNPVPDERLELVPDLANRHVPAFLLYHYSTEDANADRPYDALGRERWDVVKKNAAGKWEVVKDAKQALVESEDGKAQEISFQRTVSGVVVTKTFSLRQSEYHVGLRVEMRRPELGPNDGSREKKAIAFRYQLAGARGLPVEGKWYTSTFRNAYICQMSSGGTAYREMQDLRQISKWGGGDAVAKENDRLIRYAGVAVQYFASVIVVDDEQDKGQDQNFVAHARATLETAVIAGKLVKVAPDRLAVNNGDGKSPDEIVYLPPELRAKAASLKVGDRFAAVCQFLPYNPIKVKECPKVVVDFKTGDDVDAVHPLWEDDVTIRVNTDPVELSPGDVVAHKYLLYHGPVKPSLLRHLRGEAKVDPELVDRYADKLRLNTMTDYPSRGFPNDIGYYTGFSWLVIYCTNIIHRVLGWLTLIIPNYGICILLLTVAVRGMMYPLSRRQAKMTAKMQDLAPEIKKLSEKYKDDQTERGKAVMELYRKHGVNPLGSCWVMLLQMPVFMGLWYALQESIQFRLAPFWPTWIDNLAAPDMLISWGRSIPYLSADSSYGHSMVYLGPYFNLLPLVAVALMLVQQKMMTPPPTDEQQEMQQKMMKYMMIVMCFMFYKVAAGLCVYFIASSLWGVAERKLLPKKKPTDVPVTPDPVLADRLAAHVASGTGVTTAPSSGMTTGKKTGRNKRKDRGKVKEKELPPAGLGGFRQRVSTWWNEVLDAAKKK